MTYTNSTVIRLSEGEIETLEKAVDILSDLYDILPVDSKSMHFTFDELDTTRDIIALLADYGKEIAFEVKS